MEAARACGLDPVALIEGMPFTRGDLRARGLRVDWGHLVLAFERGGAGSRSHPPLATAPAAP